VRIVSGGTARPGEKVEIDETYIGGKARTGTVVAKS